MCDNVSVSLINHAKLHQDFVPTRPNRYTVSAPSPRFDTLTSVRPHEPHECMKAKAQNPKISFDFFRQRNKLVCAEMHSYDKFDEKRNWTPTQTQKIKVPSKTTHRRQCPRVRHLFSISQFGCHHRCHHLHQEYLHQNRTLIQSREIVQKFDEV